MPKHIRNSCNFQKNWKNEMQKSTNIYCIMYNFHNSCFAHFLFFVISDFWFKSEAPNIGIFKTSPRQGTCNRGRRGAKPQGHARGQRGKGRARGVVFPQPRPRAEICLRLETHKGYTHREGEYTTKVQQQWCYWPGGGKSYIQGKKTPVAERKIG